MTTFMSQGRAEGMGMKEGEINRGRKRIGDDERVRGLGGQSTDDDVYIRTDCWKSTYKVIDKNLKEALLISEATADSGKRAHFD